MNIEQEGLSFEQAISELQQIIENLESGKLPLEQAIKAFERGSALKDFCQKKLDEAKLQISKIATQDGKVNIIE